MPGPAVATLPSSARSLRCCRETSPLPRCARSRRAALPISFSEVPVGFGEADIQLSDGLSLVAGSLQPDAADPSGKTFTAVVTAADGFSGSGSVSLAAGSHTAAAGHAGAGGCDTTVIGTLTPLLSRNIASAALRSLPTRRSADLVQRGAGRVRRGRHSAFGRSVAGGRVAAA